MPSNLFIPETVLILDSEELKFVQLNNIEKNRLAFAIMLKFFQAKGRYPTKKDPVEPMILHSLASQLKALPPGLFFLYSLTTTDGQRH